MAFNGRDFMPKPDRPQPDLDEAGLVLTLKKMARVRLRGQDALKVQVCVRMVALLAALLRRWAGLTRLCACARLRASAESAWVCSAGST